jgi:hypothetical protein
MENLFIDMKNFGLVWILLIKNKSYTGAKFFPDKEIMWISTYPQPILLLLIINNIERGECIS